GKRLGVGFTGGAAFDVEPTDVEALLEARLFISVAPVFGSLPVRGAVGASVLFSATTVFGSACFSVFGVSSTFLATNSGARDVFFSPVGKFAVVSLVALTTG